jgi:hypothetical protein
MPFKQIDSPDPKYLAATDILIGDMSDTNYEFILFDRPIILLANKWLRENFPDIGIKMDLERLEKAIERSLKQPEEFQEQRRHWLEKTIYKADGNSSKRVLDIILKYSGIENPVMIFVHGGDEVRKSNLRPLVEEARRRNLKIKFVYRVRWESLDEKNIIFVSAHFEGLKNVKTGYKVHLDHGLKGKGTANVEFSGNDYKRHDYFPMIDLHVTAGEVGQERTQMLLGPLKDRAVIAGYPKADDLLRLNTLDNRRAVCQELGFDEGKPIITYAPAGEESYMKPGGSLSREVIDKLKEIASKNDYNILVKLKYPELSFVIRVLKKLKREIQKLYKEVDG